MYILSVTRKVDDQNTYDFIEKWTFETFENAESSARYMLKIYGDIEKVTICGFHPIAVVEREKDE